MDSGVAKAAGAWATDAAIHEAVAMGAGDEIFGAAAGELKAP